MALSSVVFLDIGVEDFLDIGSDDFLDVGPVGLVLVPFTATLADTQIVSSQVSDQILLTSEFT